MGGMMAGGGSMYAWVIVLIAVAVAVAVVGGVVAVRALNSREARSRQLRGSSEATAARAGTADAAREALRMRYARGEISREDYLQGKVELED